MSDSLRHYDTAKARLGYAAAILHTIDLDGLARIHDRLVSPQALLDGIRPAEQATAQDWVALITAARAMREASSFDDEVLDAVETAMQGLQLWNLEERQ